MSQASHKILIVDGHPTSRRIMRNMLVQAGFPTPAEASDGMAALKLLRSGGVGLVIAAREMEPVTGLQLVREMRADAALAGIPCIIVLSASVSTHVVEAREAGASTCIVRPFDAATLRQKIDTALPGA